MRSFKADEYIGMEFDAMESSPRNLAPVVLPPPDGRQSETALAIARGTARLLRSLGFT